jgi:hypothetical protein
MTASGTWPRASRDCLGWVMTYVPYALSGMPCVWRHTTVGSAEEGCRSQTGKDDCFANEPMAPRLLGAIKGTPRHMEQLLKTFTRAYNNFETSWSCLGSLEEIWARFELRLLVFIRALFSSLVYVILLHLCSCVCWYSLAYSCSWLWSYYVRCERLQLVEIPHKWEDTIRKTIVVLKFDLWVTWEGLSATLFHWDATTWR